VNEFFRWEWVIDHTDDIAERLLQHAQLTVLAVVIGFAIAFPLAIYAHRHRRFLGPLTAVTGIMYTIPSLALFALLYPFTGLSVLTAEIGLVSYTLLILVRNVVIGLDGVPAEAREAATAMGFTSRQMLWRVEVPLALPSLIAGVRLATVTTVGLVTVTAIVGQGGLGYFILLGLRRFFSTAIVLGAGLSVLLALVADMSLLALQRGITPWSRPALARGT